MDSRETYEESYNYLADIERGLTGSGITIDFNKLDEKSRAEARDILTRFCVRRKGQIWNNILSGPHSF